MSAHQDRTSGIGGFSRRRLLQLGTGAVVAGAATVCGSSGAAAASTVGPGSRAVAEYAADQRRRFPGGRTVSKTFTAAPTEVDIGGQSTTAWTYNGQMPGPLLRATVGDRVHVRLDNRLPEPTTVHWHGLAIRNDMDGVPDITQSPIAAGTTFDYEFIPPDPGTYWYHSHGDLQRGRGLYGALLIDDPHDPGEYDTEFTVVLADWLTDRTPTEVFDSIGDGMEHMDEMEEMTSPVLGGDAGDVDYPVYLLGGHAPNDPRTFSAKPGQHARIRLINAAEDTTFRVALGGHRLTVTSSDGFPVQPTETGSVLLGQGERYDAMVTLGDGAFPLVASAEGKDDRAFAVVRTASGEAPAANAQLGELAGQPLTVDELQALDGARLPDRSVDRTIRLTLQGTMSEYDWRVGGPPYPDHSPVDIRHGQRVRVVYANETTMYHPMHLHGHTFQVARKHGRGPRKDTVMVLPGQSITADFDADNPGQWFTHCHNEYHLAAGMATVVSYRS